MNNAVQQRKIRRFLKGRRHNDIDTFCIYQWIDRCHFEGWYDEAVELGSFIPPNSLNQDYQKRIEFLLGQCRNQINLRNGQFTQVGEFHNQKTSSIPKNFIDMLESLRLTLTGHGQNRMKLTYQDIRLLFLERISFDACTFHFTDRTFGSLLESLGENGFYYLAENIRKTKKTADERRPRIRMSWNDAISVLPVLFTEEYLNRIEKTKNESNQATLTSLKWNTFGHRTGSQAAKIDDLLMSGQSLANIAVSIASTISRVKGHIRHLEKEKGIHVVKPGDIYKILAESIPAEVKKSNSRDTIKAFRLMFWNAFKEFAIANQSTLNIRKIYPEHWLDIYFGHPHCHICMTINTRRNHMTCELYIPDSKELYRRFFEDRAAIEQELGEALQWHDLPQRKSSRIKLIRTVDVRNQDNWKEYFLWLNGKAEAIQKIFLRYL